MSDTETNYVAGLATRWARTDPMEQWVNAAPEGGRTPLEETIREYLGTSMDDSQLAYAPPSAPAPGAPVAYAPGSPALLVHIMKHRLARLFESLQYPLLTANQFSFSMRYWEMQ